MTPTRRKIGGKKNKNTIKYTWGIHSLTRKRMKTHTKKKKRSTKKRNSQRRRRKRGRKRKGGTPAEDPSFVSSGTSSAEESPFDSGGAAPPTLPNFFGPSDGATSQQSFTSFSAPGAATQQPNALPFGSGGGGSGTASGSASVFGAPPTTPGWRCTRCVQGA